MRVAVVAGGRAIRLGSLTDSTPKSMLVVQGRTFIEHQIEMLAAWGLCDLVLCLGHMHDQIVTHLDDGSRCGVRIEYSIEDGPLGTAGALRRARDLLGPEFLVIYGDSYLFLDFQAVARHFQSSDKLGLMTVYKNHDKFDRSNTAIRQGLIARYDKRGDSRDLTYIDYGASILRQEALDLVPDGVPHSMEDLFCDLIAKQELLAFEVNQRFYEIGSPTGLRDFEKYLEGTP